MAELLECVPNFSEGRNTETIDAIAAALRSGRVECLDVQWDSDHNRSVFTLVGPASQIVDTVFQGIVVAVERIDLNAHQGAHPRLGAVDVVPFIPLLDTKMDVAVD